MAKLAKFHSYILRKFKRKYSDQSQCYDFLSLREPKNFVLDSELSRFSEVLLSLPDLLAFNSITREINQHFKVNVKICMTKRDFFACDIYSRGDAKMTMLRQNAVIFVTVLSG
jgi:hypothetical protein